MVFYEWTSSSSSSAFPTCICGVHHFGWEFYICDFFNPTIEVVIFCLHGFISEQNLSYALWSVVCGVLWENKTFAIHWGYAVVMMFYDWTKALLYIVGRQWPVVNKHHGSTGSHGVLWMYEPLVACLRLQAHNFQWKYKRILYWKMCENSI